MKLDLEEANVHNSLEWIEWAQKQVTLGHLEFGALNRLCRSAREDHGITEKEIEEARRKGKEAAKSRTATALQDRLVRKAKAR
jgi:hypothetical protein